MATEYQIEVEYATGKESDHLIYRFNDRDIRNNIYHSIVEKFEDFIVDSVRLTTHGGIVVSIYNYSPQIPGEVAQFVPYKYFSLDALDEILDYVKERYDEVKEL